MGASTTDASLPVPIAGPAPQAAKRGAIPFQGTRRSQSQNYEFKGAAARVPEGATAFGLRRDHTLVEIVAWFADGPDSAKEQRHRQWARATRAAFDAIALPDGYPNLLAGDEHMDRVARSYGRNAQRLIEAKRRYDPDNVFRSAIALPVASAMART